jgi:hypothetical protein
MLTIPLKPFAIAAIPVYSLVAPPLFWTTLLGAFIATCIGSVMLPVLLWAVLLLSLDILIILLGMIIYGLAFSPV